MSIRFRFDGTRVEPLLRQLAGLSNQTHIERALVQELGSWPGVLMTRVWMPGDVHTPLGEPRLRDISASGVSFHIRDSIESSFMGSRIENQKLQGMGGHPLGSNAPHGVLLVFTTVPLAEDAFWWLGRVADHTTLALERGKTGEVQQIRTRSELRELERQNLLLALKSCQGKVFGDGGAAALLGMKPTTLASRLKALNVVQPKNANISQATPVQKSRKSPKPRP